MPTKVTTTTAEGFAKCINPECDHHDEYRPCRFTVETVSQSAHDMPSMVITTTEHRVPESDADVHCPACGSPRALLSGKAPTYPKANFSGRAA